MKGFFYCFLIVGIALTLMVRSGAGSDVVGYSARQELLAREFLERTGQLSLVVLKVDAIIAKSAKSFSEKANPVLVDEFVTRLRKEVTEDAFAGIIAPIYAKHFSESELSDIVEFYKSETGKKLARLSFSLSREIKIVTEEWARRISRKIVNDMRKEYPRRLPGRDN